MPLVYSVVLLLYTNTTSVVQKWVLATGLLNVWFAAVALFRDKKPYSINRMFWLFVLVFMGMVPGFQIALRQFPWGNDILPETCLTANLIVWSGSAVYQLTRYVLAANLDEKPLLFKSRIDDSWLKSWQTVGLTGFILLALTYFAITGADAILLQKDILLKWRDEVPDAVFLLVEKAIRSPVLYFGLLSVFLFRLRRISKTTLVLILAIGLLVNFPLALPRTLAATVGVSLLLSFGGRYWQRYRQAFTLLILAGLLLAFPLMQLARRTSDRMAVPQHATELYAFSFLKGDFDAYSMLCRTVAFTDTNGFRKGRQLQTALAFAVPRTVWPQKGIGSGAYVSRASGKTFINVSCPLVAEGFIDFGWLGTWVYCVLFAVLAYRYDRYYWYWRTHRASEGDLSFKALFYPAMLVLLFHLLRGDLLSSLAQVTGMYGCAWGAHQLIWLGAKGVRYRNRVKTS